MNLHGGFRLLASEEDLTGGAIRMPHQILRDRVGRPDPVIFDVGAATGNMVERYLSLFDAPTIHCFEPQAAAFSELYHRFGKDPRVRANNVALAERRGVADLHRVSYHESTSLLELSPDSWWAKTQNLTPEGDATVALDTVDLYCAERGVERIDLLKLDIQGAEPECLAGAAATLAANKVGVVQAEIILHRLYARAGCFAAIEAALAPHGFRLFTMYDVMIAPTGELLQLDALYVRQ